MHARQHLHVRVLDPALAIGPVQVELLQAFDAGVGSDAAHVQSEILGQLRVPERVEIIRLPVLHFLDHRDPTRGAAPAADDREHREELARLHRQVQRLAGDAVVAVITDEVVPAARRDLAERRV
jgi:hypothetical protein